MSNLDPLSSVNYPGSKFKVLFIFSVIDNLIKGKKGLQNNYVLGTIHSCSIVNFSKGLLICFS